MSEIKQAFNPYLPFDVCIPDGEPHVFDDRVYVYGSHDKEGGDLFCMLDYEVFSAPISDLSDWRSEGISYRAAQDPDYGAIYQRMYAPDVVKGNDGRYYLYYAMSGKRYTGPIHVAVSDKPSGKFEYYGCVRNPDGSDYTRNITFDPAVINDDGVIRLYYGWSLAFPPEKLENRNEEFDDYLVKVEMALFEKTKEEIENSPEGICGGYTVELEEDMLTVKTEPVRVIPGQVDADNTSFFGYAFFEASSIRKVGDTYYFVYSSQWQHELCYATSKYPDRDFVFGGVIISNGDIGYNGRLPENRLAATGNNHGGIEYINGEWYVFYHRQTHKTTYSRQGCAEKIGMDEKGKITQVEMTSCGLNPKPLTAKGTYSSYIACVLTNGRMPHIDTNECKEDIPYLTNNGSEHFITNISDGTSIGFKHFLFNGKVGITIRVKGVGKGKFDIFADSEFVGEIEVSESERWTEYSADIAAKGVKALYFNYSGIGKFDFIDFTFGG